MLPSGGYNTRGLWRPDEDMDMPETARRKPDEGGDGTIRYSQSEREGALFPRCTVKVIAALGCGYGKPQRLVGWIIEANQPITRTRGL
jgi:hypothetical protein